MMTIAITHAKIGRSMKKRDMSAAPLLLCHGGRRRARDGGSRDGLHRDARTDLLQAIDDELVAGLEPLGDEPFVAYRAGRLERALLDLALGAEYQRRRVAFRVARHRLLRRENG